jgi:hypothetical protein
LRATRATKRGTLSVEVRHAKPGIDHQHFILVQPRSRLLYSAALQRWFALVAWVGSEEQT